MHEEDVVTARRCAAGDAAAFEILVRNHQGLLVGLAWRVVGNREDAEDAAVVAFERFWSNPRAYRGDCSLKAYLCRICLNHCATLRKRRRPIEMPPPPPGDARFEEILCALQRLPDGDREILILYYLDELTYEEIGAALGIRYDVLRTRLTRARARMRQILGIDERP
ncbi:MAG: RNA polymerase sigma factor [Fimbriimonas sp.]